MEFLTKEDKKINELYTKIKDLEEGKKIIESAMHKNFYNRVIYDELYCKLNKVKAQIKENREELKKEKLASEKSRKNI